MFENKDVQSMLNPCVENCNSILDFFNYFVNGDMIDCIVINTNKKICRLSNKKHDLITPNEIRGFIGLLLFFGYLHKNNVPTNDIWSSESSNYLYYATSVMSRDRFQLISVYISFDCYETRQIRLLF